MCAPNIFSVSVFFLFHFFKIYFGFSFLLSTQGEVLFRSWNDLFRGSRASEFHSALQKTHNIYSFNSRNIFEDSVWPHKVVWHGGGPSGERQLDSSCNSWTSNDEKTFGVAASLTGSSLSHQQQSNTIGGNLLAQEKFSCEHKFVVLCIEIAYQGGATKGRVKRMDEHVSEDQYQDHIQSLL